MRIPFLAISLACTLSLSTTTLNAQGALGAYLAGRQANEVSDFQSAAQYFTRALALGGRTAETYENLIFAQLALGQIKSAKPIADKFNADGFTSQFANMAILTELAKYGAYDRILKQLDAEQGIGHLVDGLIKGWALAGTGDIQGASAAFDKMGQEKGLSGFATYHKGLMLATVGDYAAAEDQFARVESDPTQMTRRAVILRIIGMLQMDQFEQAATYMDALFKGVMDPELAALRAMIDVGAKVDFPITSAAIGMAEVFFAVADVLSAESDDEYTLIYGRLAEYLNPQHIDVILLNASLLDRLGQYNLSAQVYRQIPQNSAIYYVAELGRADTLRKSGRVDAAIEALTQLARSHGTVPDVHTSLGNILRREEQYKAAIDAYDKAIALYETPERSQWFTHYGRAISYERLDLWDLAEADFRKALELSPDQPQVLNYLGYSMVEKQINLTEAQELIAKAVELSPESGYIIDSLGWVLFRLGKYQDAVPHLEKAAELMSIDPIVNDHLGDAYWAVGRKLEARFQWNRALSFDPEEKEAIRIRRKLEIGLDAVLKEEGAAPLVLVENDD